MKKITSLLFLSISISSLAFAQLTNEPDVISTGDGNLTIYPINHGSIALTFNDHTIFVDPFGGADLFSEFSSPDIIFITDIHGDHLNMETLESLDTENTTFVVPEAVADRMGSEFSDQLVIINNDESKPVADLSVRAVPMYNLPEQGSRHTKGRGNGYIITFGDKNVYISGDTEDIPEMRSLENIDIAFVCMNLPYTMDIYQAASAVVEFQPVIMYPYHHRGQDIEKFKQIIDIAEIETDVRLKNWYSN